MLRRITSQNGIDFGEVRQLATENKVLKRLGIETEAFSSDDTLRLLWEFTNELLQRISFTRSELDACQTDFENQFSRVAPKPYPDWCPDVSVDWLTFQNKVLEDVRPEEVERLAVRFIHRFNGTTWYLSVQRLIIDWPAGENPVYNTRYPLTQPADATGIFSVFQSKSGDGVSSPAVGLSGSELDLYDANYFGLIKSVAHPVTLDLETDAKSITFPWRELTELQARNSFQGARAKHNFQIVFRSITYDLGEAPDPEISLVQWPHTLAIFMRHLNDDCLDNDNTVIFNKADDLGGICPPRCPNIYWTLDGPQ